MTSTRLLPVATAFALAFAVAATLGCQPPRPEPTESAEVPVTATTVEPTAFRPSIPLLGKVAAAAAHELKAPAAGQLRYTARFAAGLVTGARVRRGETLFTIEAPEMRHALAEAELNVEKHAAELERTRRLVEGAVLSNADYEKAAIEDRLARERLRDAKDAHGRLAVTAPQDGVLRVDQALPSGSQIDAGTVVAVLAADGKPRVEAWAAAADLGRLEPGLEVELRAAGGSELVGRGRLSERSAGVDASGLGRVVVTVDDATALPLAGEGVEARVLLALREGALTVPERALVIDAGVASVFVLEPVADAHRARARMVVLGGRDGDRVEVLDGLAAGDAVAVEGAELLADGVAARLVAEAGS